MTGNSSALPFDLKSLEIFLAVCESGSMAAAARQLGLTQPAVSLAVAELERKSATTFFDRSVRPVALTLSGEFLRQHASALLAEARQIVPLLSQTKSGNLPLIRVGLVDSLSRSLTVPLSNFLKGCAGEVSVLSGLTASHARDLLTRRLDLFLGVDDLQDLPGLERWELLREPYVLLLPPKSKPVRSVADLKKLAADVPFIRFSARSQTGQEIERHLRRLKIDAPRALEFDTPFGLTSMVAAGEGFAITTPLCVTEAKLSVKAAQMMKLPGPRITRRLSLVARRGELGNIPRDLVPIAKRALQEAGAG